MVNKDYYYTELTWV